jgi:hypothetical protein
MRAFYFRLIIIFFFCINSFSSLYGQCNEVSFRTDAWRGHIYNKKNLTDYNTCYDETESFNQNFGTDDDRDWHSFSGAGGFVRGTFSVRYRMKSTKQGCYVADLAADDGIRLDVDGQRIFDEWVDQGTTTYINILINLNGSSQLVYEYYENAGGNTVSFQNFRKLNDITGGKNQTICSGERPSRLRGTEVLERSTKQGRRYESNHNTTYRWEYSVDGGVWQSALGNNTNKNYQPPVLRNNTSVVKIYRFRRVATYSQSLPKVKSKTYVDKTAVSRVVVNPSVGNAIAISGKSNVNQGANGVIYSVPVIKGATDYVWTLPTGVSVVSGNSTRSITVNFANNALSGNIKVYGRNSCGNGNSRSLSVTVKQVSQPSLSISDISVNEDAGVAVFVAKLNKPSSNDVSFRWCTSDWTAKGPNDYIRVPWTEVTIPAGQLSVNLEVTIVDDRKYEGNEKFSVYLRNSVYAVIVKDRVSCTIIDNESNASIEVDKQSPENAYTADQLVQEVLVTGCLTANGVTFTGDEAAGLGYFSAESSDFPLKSGLILSNGNVINAEGPNSGNSKSDDNSGFHFDEHNRDSDLMTLAGTYWDRKKGTWKKTYLDAQILEFYFVPAGDKLEFSYIFASEEYPKYACSKFNDGFAFIISGEGITNDSGLSGKNIALIPGSTDWVTINNVNGSRDNGTGSVCGSSDNYVDGSDSYATSFNGRTRVLKANADVVPCTTYHIKLIVYDNSDTQVNSAVFLEAKSFVSNEVFVENRLDNIEGDKDVMYRGCDESYISFSRKERLDEAYSFGVTITGSAVNGVDYYLLNPDGSNAGKFPDRITFPVGESELKYYYMASDAVKGEKDILFEVLIGCPCNAGDSDYFRKAVKIFDIAEIEASAVSNVTCNGGNSIATVIIKLKENLDTDNYLYSIDGGDFQASNRFQGNIFVGDHQVIIKDIFSCKSKEVIINVPEPTTLKADAGTTFKMCERDDTKELNGKGGIDYLWTCDKAEGLIDMDLTVPNPKISPLVTAGTYIYTLTVSDGVGNACSSSEDVEVSVMATPTLTLSTDKLEVCSGAEISLNADVKKAINPSYQWTPIGEVNHPNQQNVIAVPSITTIASRTYTLEVTSDNGCHVKQSISGIKVFPLPVVALNVAVSNLCSDGTNGEIMLEVTGGTPNASLPLFDYVWTPATVPNTHNPVGLKSGIYSVTVSDSKSCSQSTTVTIAPKPSPRGIYFN